MQLQVVMALSVALGKGIRILIYFQLMSNHIFLSMFKVETLISTFFKFD